ncbi:uncharacterized protein CDAR_540691 [Caerostris darwini]|uniref:Uncharacterized protein n=1 Tax=Caerostris darwini TaxID=1538125 RepID=A0AAV4VMP5_9ARAC|nr:uncharacterized protein CDAR_540691 [Caerostris darwini]
MEIFIGSRRRTSLQQDDHTSDCITNKTIVLAWNQCLYHVSMEYVMGSFFTKDDMPQYCYTLYSLWGAPNKKRERIPKGSIMKFHFNLNATKRSSEITVAGHTAWFPKFSLPTTPSVQIGVHTPYFLPSPYVMGSGYQGGKAYELRVLMEETHLLPSPYQTNCTDYLKEWRERGGKGPVNQISSDYFSPQGVVQECRVKKYSELWGCVPLNVDYPHTENICGTNIKKNGRPILLMLFSVTVPVQDCMLLADSYNQPCDSLSYETDKEEVDITLIHFVQSRFLPSVEEVRTKIQGHDCAKEKMWKPECSVIDIEILFDRFEITNLTYNPKFESLELFSVIGGYMGMWLGISLVAVYDFMATALGWAQRWTVTKRRKRIKSNKKDSIHVAGAPRKVWNEQKLRNGYYDW